MSRAGNPGGTGVGRHRRSASPNRYRGAHRAPRPPALVAAGPPAAALAAVTITALAATAPSAAAAELSPAHQPGVSALAAYQPRPAHLTTTDAPSLPAVYTVRSGDTLSAIAARFYGSADLWPALWWVNKGTVGNPDAITAGEDLKLSQWHPQAAWLAAAAGQAVPRPAPQPVLAAAVGAARGSAGAGSTWGAASGRGDRWDGQHSQCGDGDGDGMDMPCSQLDGGTSYRTVASVGSSGRHSYSGGSYGSVSPGNYSGFQACVIARESGGNSQVMNASGHYGLYQFSASTWAAYGGSSASFGHASVAQQNAVFATAMAQGGQSNWSPYDGC